MPNRLLLLPHLDDALSGTQNAGLVHGAGCDDINAGLCPQHVPVVLYIAKRGPHVVDGHKTIDAKCRGEYVADGLPN